MKAYRLFVAAAAVLAPFAAQAQSKKPTVAVVKIDDLTGSVPPATLSAMIESAVAATGRFRLIEREQMGKLVGEQARAKGGMVTTNTPGRVGAFEGVDYLIYGTVTSIGAKKNADIGGSLVAGFLGNHGATCTNTVATLSLDVKITDTDTGEIKYSRHLDQAQKGASSCSGEANIDGPALMRAAADHIANDLVTSIYPIQVAAVEPDGTLMLNYGQGSIEPGAVMAVFAKGTAIKDPTTGEVIGASDTQLGLVRVSEVMGRLSKAVPATQFASAIPVGALIRPASDQEIRALNKPARRR